MCSHPLTRKRDEARGTKKSVGIRYYEEISSDEDDTGMCFVV